jgi:hypothetical protein
MTGSMMCAKSVWTGAGPATEMVITSWITCLSRPANSQETITQIVMIKAFKDEGCFERCGKVLYSAMLVRFR